MEEYSGGVAAGHRAAGGSEHGPPPSARYEAAVNAYLIQLIGPARAAPARERAFRELAEVLDRAGAVPPNAESVRAVARGAGLAGLDIEVRGLGRRLARLAAGRVGCAAVARRLRARAAGEMSVQQLYGFYEHLGRCDRCADIVVSFDESEWSLMVALRSLDPAEPTPASTREAEMSRRLALAPRSEPKPEPVFAPTTAPEPTPTATSPTKPAPEPEAQPAPSVADPARASASPSTPGAPPPSDTARSRPSAPRSRRPLQALVLALGVAAAAALATLPTSKAPTQPAAIPPTTKTTIKVPPTPVLAYSHGRTFTLAGARFTVFVNDDDRWATFTKTVSPGRGDRWELVTVNVKNLTRSDFDPRVLHYRVLAGRVAYFPNTAYGTAPDARRPPRPVARGRTVDVELAVRVPVTTSGLELAFDPLGQPARVTVTLGR
jgi:hypothetical protein